MEIIDKEKQSFFAETKTLIEDYIEDQIYLTKLQAGEKAARMISSLYIVFFIGLMLFIILMIVTVIAGYFLAFLTDNFIIGFGIMALLYVIVIFVVYAMHKKFLGKKVMDAVVKMIFDNKDETNAI